MGWRRHKKVIDLVKGYRGRAKNCWTVAVNRHEKALQHAYKHRRTRRRESRRNWIVQVNAGARQHGVKYSHFINGLAQANIELDRKILAELAVTEPYSFKAVVETVKASAPAALTTPLPPTAVEAAELSAEEEAVYAKM